MSRFSRQSGVFAHPTSLPSSHGIGSIGQPSREFVHTLADADQSLWQLCPLGPLSSIHGNSPYQAYSAFAIEPLLIDLDLLVEEELLTAEETTPAEPFSDERVDYDAVREFKYPLLRTAFERFDEERPAALWSDFESFQEETDWLENYALFRALKREFDGQAWTDWPEPVALHESTALDEYREKLADEIRYREFLQFVAARQWDQLRNHATQVGVKIVGDMPIYVAQDSADVWAHPELFELKDDGTPKDVSGVPSDGNNPAQKWGPPVYDWAEHEATGYQWWIDRLDRQLELADIVRLDHFRGFEEYYAIPAEGDGSDGEWRSGPGLEFFRTIEDGLGELPIIAEDIGFVTEEIEQLRRDIDAPGMKVMQYADWCSEEHIYLPHTYERDTVAYPGTHDTNTVRGWYESLDDRQVECLHYYLGTDGTEIHWDLIERAWHTASVMAITPLQDLYGLGAEARFNTPGTESGNWDWRCTPEGLDQFPIERLRTLTDEAGR